MYQQTLHFLTFAAFLRLFPSREAHWYLLRVVEWQARVQGCDCAS